MPSMRSAFEVFRYRGVKMIGVLNRPAGKGKFPAVLFLHGFPGSEKNVDIQRALMARGVASLLLHFQGAWGSEGYYRFSSLVDEALAGLRVLRRKPFVDKKRVALFGFSMGGWAAINAAARDGGVAAVAAVAPVGGREMVGPGLAGVVAHHAKPLRVRSGAALRRDFIASVSRHQPAESAARLSCPLLLVHGTKDDVVPYPVSERIYAAARPPKRLVKAEGASHDFLDRREWLTKTVAGWFSKTLAR